MRPYKNNTKSILIELEIRRNQMWIHTKKSEGSLSK